MDWTSAFVGAAVVLVVSFGANQMWLWFGKSPRERTEKRLRKWKERSQRRFG